MDGLRRAPGLPIRKYAAGDDEIAVLLSPGYVLPADCGACGEPTRLDGTCANGHDVLDGAGSDEVGH